MPTDPPIACSLDASALSDRLAHIAELGGSALLDAGIDGRCALLRFTAGGEVRGRMDDIVAAEARCCAFLGICCWSVPRPRSSCPGGGRGRRWSGRRRARA